jgi:transcriptional regulator with XRE-family HTH domain
MQTAAPQNEFAAMGQQLKERRQELNLSLKEVENGTSIRMSYLKAIEEGDASHLISNIYARGFIKQYANFVGLNGEELVKEHSIAFSGVMKQDFDYGIGTLEHRTSHSGGISSLPNLGYAAGFIVIATAAYYFAKFMGVL